MSYEMQNQSYTPTNGNGRATAPILRTGSWMLTILLLGIPLVNIIMLFVWAFGDNTNPNKRNYARASLLLAAIVIGIYAIIAVLVIVLAAVGSQ